MTDRTLTPLAHRKLMGIALIALLPSLYLTASTPPAAVAAPEPQSCIVQSSRVEPGTRGMEGHCVGMGIDPANNPCKTFTDGTDIGMRCTVPAGCEDRTIHLRAWLDSGDPGGAVAVKHNCGSSEIAAVSDTEPEPSPRSGPPQWEETSGRKTSGDYVCEVRFVGLNSTGIGECYDDVAVDPGGGECPPGQTGVPPACVTPGGGVPAASDFGLGILLLGLVGLGTVTIRRRRST